MGKETYNPRGKTAEILTRALEIVGSVPYHVSARWVFYRLLQEGYYRSKSDYKNKLLPALSDARHAEWNGWQPDTLADETREAIPRGNGYRDPLAWLTAISDGGLKCHLDYWYAQPCYAELWYEARAMTDQFRHYTQFLTLRPMGGQASIPYKSSTAHDLDRSAAAYNKPVVVLYFGDLDRHGQIIASVIERDVRKWCNTPFRFIHCGLTMEQVYQFDVPENFEKPGAYQWEALTDQAAQEIITTSTAPFVSHDDFANVAAQETAVTDWLRSRLRSIVQDYAA